MPTIKNKTVADVFDSYPPAMRARLLKLRTLILQVAATTDGVGDIDETLKWGEPAYLTTQTGSGSTIRLGWKKKYPTQYAMYFHCQTNLVETFRTLFPHDFQFEGNRSIVFDEHDEVPLDALAFCIATALTYHADKKSAAQRAKK